MNDFERFIHAAPKEGSEAESEVGQLLRSAGARPQLGEAEFATLKESAREEWQKLVAVEAASRNSWSLGLAMAATLALALAAAWWWQSGAAPGGGAVVATLLQVEGTVQGSEGTVLTLGSTLEAGARVATTAGDSRAALRLAGGHFVRVDAQTEIRLVTGSRFELERGAVYFDSVDGTGDGGIEIVTAFGTVRDVGTQFEVRLDKAASEPLRVRVREGAISLEREGSTHSASGGEELRLSADGGVVVAETPGFGTDWDWTLAVAPGFEIDGQPLESYLAWVERQTGWSVSFESAELESSAATVRLGGTIESLTATESLSVVLPGSGMDYRVDDGQLLISVAGVE